VNSLNYSLFFLLSELGIALIFFWILKTVVFEVINGASGYFHVLGNLINRKSSMYASFDEPPLKISQFCA
jgi:hypothetical protein